METLFFWTSKIVWLVVSPENLLVLMAIGTWILLKTGDLRNAKRWQGATAILLIVFALLPIGEWILYPLEDRFTNTPALPPKVDGIIVLGGGEDSLRSAAWSQVELSDAAERLVASMALARRYPNAKLVFTGGNSSLVERKDRGSDVARTYYDEMGLDPMRLLLETNARNTAENVSYSKALAKPRKGEAWVLITSAAHMPRSIGIFCRAGWDVIAYPVDHRAVRGDLLRISPTLTGNLGALSAGIKEWMGLVAYYVTGRSDSLLPRHCGNR